MYWEENMKKSLAMLVALAVSTCTLAAGLNKGSQQLNSLGLAWKSHQSTQIKLNKDDILMGYAGDDISRKPTLVTQTTTL